MKQFSSRIPALSCVFALFASAESALAQNPNYAPGDLILFFQKEGGTNTVYANLGNAATSFRGAAAGPGAANRINFVDIGTVLGAAFGPDWASDPTIYAGLAGAWGTSSTLSNNTLQDGDPNRTLYVSEARSATGTPGQSNSPGYVVNTNTGMTNGASSIFSQNNIFEVNYSEAAVVSPTGVSFIDDQNPFLFSGIQGTAFQIFASGVQQAGSAQSFGTLGGAGNVEFALDLYRILGKNNAPGQVAGPLREGTFEGTVTVNSAGMVSFISQGAAPPANAYDTWIGSFNPPLSDPEDRLAAEDPDMDGYTNLAEFVLNGNPGTSSQAIAPVLDASGTNFVFTFNRRDDSKATAPVIFQYGSDLAAWTDVAIGDTSGPVGAATVGVAAADSTIDVITVTVPKPVGGKLFGRIKIVQ